mmetsp:Transcript_37303/g.123569  ORF Transcript_37303/g.123569 Transcript_37303/m.123569 type:complete len:230 (+) Transcript_37303:382-1071(+)
MCRSTSKRSSTPKPCSISPLYRSASSFARAVNGVCTCATPPSDIRHCLGADICASTARTRCCRTSPSACNLSRSMVWSNRCSLMHNACSAALCPPSGPVLILAVSSSRHASSSEYSTSKSSSLRGRSRLSAFLARAASPSAARASSASARLCASASLAARPTANSRRANHPRACLCTSTVASRRSAASASESKYGSGARSTSLAVSMYSPDASICVEASRTDCCDTLAW